MWKLTILVLCTLTLTRADEENPFLDLASSLLQNMGDGGNNNGLGAIGNIMGALMQGQEGEGNGAGDVLSGLGSLLGGQDGKIDPAMIGTMISMFSQMNENKTPPKEQRQKRQTNNENDLNLEGMLSMASGLLGNKNVASLLPVLMNSLNSISNPEKHIAAHEHHKNHADFLPPFLEKIHLYWDLFVNSELGKTVWEKSGMRKALKSFTGPDGSLSFELMMKNFENHSFRRHWIKAAAKYLTDMVMHMAKPEVYQRYITSAEYIVNSFLDAQGLPKSTHFNVKTPEKSITVLLNFVLKRYLDMDTDVGRYVKPAIDYLKQTLKMAQATSASLTSRGDYNALADRLTDALNLEIIEPVLRVYRAYKHSVKAPHCQEHLMCLVNRRDQDAKEDIGRGARALAISFVYIMFVLSFAFVDLYHCLPGFKAGLTKLSSIAASAALSFQNGKGFWDLYNAIQSDANCEAKYPADCASFHEHELKVTTEVYHSEL